MSNLVQQTEQVQLEFVTLRNGGKYVKLTEPAIDKRIKIYAADAHKRCLEVPLATHAHQFRHAKATHWLEDGMNIIQIRFLLGHASLNTTMRYLDITTDDKRQALATLENEFGFVSKSKLLDFPTMPTTTESLSFIIFHKIENFSFYRLDSYRDISYT